MHAKRNYTSPGRVVATDTHFCAASKKAIATKKRASLGLLQAPTSKLVLLLLCAIKLVCCWRRSVSGCLVLCCAVLCVKIDDYFREKALCKKSLKLKCTFRKVVLASPRVVTNTIIFGRGQLFLISIAIYGMK